MHFRTIYPCRLVILFFLVWGVPMASEPNYSGVETSKIKQLNSQTPASSSRQVYPWSRQWLLNRANTIPVATPTPSPVTTLSRSIRLTLPPVKSQDDDWSCGVNSSARVLKYYGYNVTYDQLRDLRKKKFQIPVLNRLPFARGSLPFYRFGTRPGGVRELLNIYKRDNQILEQTQMTSILQVLRQNKPVITLIRPDDITRSLPFGRKITLPVLHWIVVSGFDEDQKKIFYYDTNGNSERSYTYDQFMARWNWSHRLFSTGLRFKPRTIVY